jgi:acyl-CoA reductase-like NAD-dependent aldehyde dehydrogenase
MGNVVVMKLPSVGGLSHVLSMNAFAAALPPGVINFISGKDPRSDRQIAVLDALIVTTTLSLISTDSN